MVGLSGLAMLIIWVMIARNPPFELGGMMGVWSGPHAALTCIFFVSIPMVLWSVLVDKVHLNPSTGIDWKKPKPIADIIDISKIKLVGLWATWLVIAIVYASFRWYWQGDYLFAMKVLMYSLPVLFIGSIFYIVWLDRYLIEPRDYCWHFGQWLIGKPGYDMNEIKKHARAWGVKGFYIAFMLSIVSGGYRYVVEADMEFVFSEPAETVKFIIWSMFLIDVHLAMVGYILTVRPLDSHIRSANPFMSGWVAALICYPPFVLMNNGSLIDYHVGTMEWTYWFNYYPSLIPYWGAGLIFLTAIYAWATMAFGLRFSNLTNRGILTHGPYRWTRHPAYLSKNLFWWCSTLPFLVVHDSTVDIIRNTLMLAAVSGVYYWRARTEEMHLMEGDDYKIYYAWMERNAPVPRFFNWLSTPFRNRGKWLASDPKGDTHHNDSPSAGQNSQNRSIEPAE